MPGSTVQEVEVILADTGTGMSRETLAHIFDPMFTTKQIGTGAGLGLAICDQIVRQHAGTILRRKRDPDRDDVHNPTAAGLPRESGTAGAEQLS